MIRLIYLLTIVISVVRSFAGAVVGAASTHGALVLVDLATDGGGNEFALAIDNTTADPNLYTHATVGGVSLGERVVDVGTEGVEGGTALFVMLGTRHFGTTDTTGDGDLDTFGTHSHGGGDGGLDGATILDAAFDLLSDVLSNEDGIEFGAFHLGDVDLNVLAGEFFELFFEFVNFLTTLADDETRTSGVDSDR